MLPQMPPPPPAKPPRVEKERTPAPTADPTTEPPPPDDWTDPVGSAIDMVDWLATLSAEVVAGLISDIAHRRADNAAILNVLARWHIDHDWSDTRAFLRDDVWCGDLGLSIAHHRVIGVPSMGPFVLAVLETAVNLGGATATLVTDRRAVRWGLGYLGLPIELAKPETADVFLLPALASHRDRVWTDQVIAAAASRAKERQAVVTVVTHPACRLSDQIRLSYRPPPTVVDLLVN
jgi:hypothetical protein